MLVSESDTSPAGADDVLSSGPMLVGWAWVGLLLHITLHYIKIFWNVKYKFHAPQMCQVIGVLG